MDTMIIVVGNHWRTISSIVRPLLTDVCLPCSTSLLLLPGTPSNSDVARRTKKFAYELEFSG